MPCAGWRRRICDCRAGRPGPCGLAGSGAAGPGCALARVRLRMPEFSRRTASVRLASSCARPPAELCCRSRSKRRAWTAACAGGAMPHRAQIEEDVRFQMRWWQVERVGWLLMGPFMAAAAVGVFGGGRLSRARTGEADGPQVEYQRLLRAHAAAGRTGAACGLCRPGAARAFRGGVRGAACAGRAYRRRPARRVRRAPRPSRAGGVRLRARRAGTPRGAFIAGGRAPHARAGVSMKRACHPRRAR
jgi:hypothetical protein